MSGREFAPAFTLEDARQAGLSKDRIYSLLHQGEIERMGRGVYVWPDSIPPAFITLAAATRLHSDATLCLTSALVHHDLSDAIPFTSDIALPRGTHRRRGRNGATRWHQCLDARVGQCQRNHAIGCL